MDATTETRPLTAGSPLINVPAHSGNAMLFEDIPLGEQMFSVGGGVNYVSRRLGETGTTFYLPSYALIKLVASCELTGHFKLSAEINNLLDRDPPVLPSEITNTGSGNVFASYDTLGREYFLGATVKF